MNKRDLLKKYVIRKRIGPVKSLAHLILFALLWLFVVAIVVINLGFITGYYSDTMVSFYLLFNLNQVLYRKILVAIAVLVIIVIVYCLIRTIQLRRHHL